MGSKKTLIVLVAAFVLLLVGAFVLYSGLRDQLQPSQLATNAAPHPDNTVPSAETTGGNPSAPPAPDFTVYDAEGKEWSLSDFKGKPVVINFWASWCGPCKSEMPEFEEIFKRYGDRVHFLMVNLTDGDQETVQSASEFISRSGYTFPVYYDTKSFAATAYSVSTIPATYFIDAEGYGIAWASGALDLATIEKGIGLILPNA